jgi:hypothetical protein
LILSRSFRLPIQRATLADDDDTPTTTRRAPKSYLALLEADKARSLLRKSPTKNFVCVPRVNGFLYFKDENAADDLSSSSSSNKVSGFEFFLAGTL